jgi:hypothetical protein
MDSNPSSLTTKPKPNTMLKGTDPKLTLDGTATRGKIQEGMGNKPHLGHKKATVFSDKPLPTVGKMYSK